MKEFRQELVKYYSKEGFSYDFVKNNKSKFSVVCSQRFKTECPWCLSGVLQKYDGVFVLKKADFNHNCSGFLIKDDTKRLTPKLIAQLVEGSVRMDPTFPAHAVRSHFANTCGFHISYAKAWRTLQSARENIFGAFEESFDQLHWYSEACRQTNPGTIVKHIDPETSRFKSFFVAFNACLEGFKTVVQSFFLMLL